jgi:mono/diheme cytochrome c family protein
MKTNQFLIILALLFLLLSGCKHESTVPLSNLASDSTRYKGITCSKDTVYFLNSIGPLIITSCAIMKGCHNGNNGEASSLTNYSNIMRYVSAGNSGSSRLYNVLSGNGEGLMPRPPYAPFTTTQKALVAKWIQQGAKNNGCIDTSCDTTAVTYSATVSLIFSTNCIGCHSASGTSTTKLDSYTGVKAAVTAGRILGAIQHLTGFIAMPPGSSLSTCDINKIKAWIHKGSLNN